MKPMRPSAMQKFMACPYKWGQEELCGVEQPPSDSTDLGTKFHRELELWLGSKRPPSQVTQEGKMARVALVALPPASRLPISVEREISFTYGGVPYLGHIDADWMEHTVIRYHDHKSTSSLGWAKNEDDLREDPQHIVYGYGLLFAPGDRYVTEVHASWQYTETSPPYKSALVQIRRRPAEVERDMRALHETVGVEMARYLRADNGRELAETLPKNFKHCSAYGWRAPDGTKHKGCYLIDHCHRGLDPRHRLKAIMTQQSLRDRLLKRKQELGLAPDKPTEPEPEPDTGPVADNPSLYAEVAGEPEPTPEEAARDVTAPAPEPPKSSRRRRRSEATELAKEDHEARLPTVGVRTSVLAVNEILTALEPFDREGKIAILAAVKELMR